MEMNILHLYPDCMSLYGEYANVAVLKRHLEALGVVVNVKKNLLDDAPDFTDADFIYMGCGTERTQKAVMMQLKDRGADLKAALDRGAVVLFTGNAMEVLGKSVTDANGQVWPGMGLSEFASVETDKRFAEDVIAEMASLEKPVVGFINKCTTTVETTEYVAPMFYMVNLGYGNHGLHNFGEEGWQAPPLFATHITGPLLAKNPHVTHLMMEQIFDAKGWEKPEQWPVLPHEREAYEVTLRELSARVKEN